MQMGGIQGWQQFAHGQIASATEQHHIERRFRLLSRFCHCLFPAMNYGVSILLHPMQRCHALPRLLDLG